ncbi:Pre-mRNA-splicing factor SLU7 [Tetrabaena socialis]|uniref:Pre-mRNA-splicing factor SLU7 n=1 Tax=Tetrabaena socialis TaxID=47790 RepID=A0A2J7ZTD9_9CHLO|nr:Pre-mRNA-splicing factor SLU7 [Tetrabaena socialis]|eukprot:PNH03500.1 Pre-mRNA-splicing factor SLU7 [Tetrabaena socialis]
MSFKTGDEWRRQKELEEARKAGLAPAEVDENGKEINPHIPQYMTTAPWYLNSDKPTLKHQRNWNEKKDGSQWYDRGVKTFQATKWRKGACENCGAITHKTKDCLERPREKGAKFTNKNIAADEKVEELQLAGFESKRDRWNGYDSKEYSRVVDRFEQLDDLRKEMKKKEQLDILHKSVAVEEVAGVGGEAAEGGAIDDDETKIKEEEEAGFGEVKKRVRTAGGGGTGSVRNLRIREDTAKYLLNLDPNSAYYDPKSRSMREDPQPDKPMSEKTFQGDNFVRNGGEHSAWQSLTMHSIEAHEKGLDVHMQANPSLAEMLYKQFKEKKDVLEVDAAMRKLEERERAALEGDRSKRKYHSVEDAGGEHVSAEEMEAYRIKKGRGDDPLAVLEQAKAAGAAAGTDGYELL